MQLFCYSHLFRRPKALKHAPVGPVLCCNVSSVFTFMFVLSGYGTRRTFQRAATCRPQDKDGRLDVEHIIMNE